MNNPGAATPHKPTGPTPSFEVGARVRTRHSIDRDADAASWPLEAGSIVEDFADFVDSSSVGRDWAVAHRWAVALDNGCLVFRDTDDLEAAGDLNSDSESSARKQ
ncbi:hypothetical protein HQ325_11915 [Rhodococcus sp. BP-349]|nr:hypothetical protein [Rhodococcus sp. BP-363]MBY6544292.1 hypothetical protein [Rhodococcus sp. BP-369]MBY6563522.1 hypothetical protein [Rhodococcus sp. BP-370]MBY6577814.1 hypothetical protein [Rhodococcus sp. BP-364]MBY6587115.1 hypothetical protein [Rhodococcus sp. BP-358]MBY6591452.1 hypothetical protein [Rhodococcus sp. BP-362]MBY6595214.1 hypothetical protein [Rhodococcus sp. BP-359]MBY6599553.1 hypothetical protein [Rhodococcus sp. BP-353]MBY6603890.1 hypothetical protein [Rhodoc